MCFGPRVSDLNSAHFDPTPHATATQASRPVTGGECASRTHRTRVLREPPHRGARRATKEQRRRAERRNNATGQQSKAQKNTRADCELRQRKAEYPRTPRAPRVSRVARRVRRTADGGGVASAEAGSGARERRARSGEKRTAKHRTNAGCALRERTAPGLPGRRARRVRPRACSWCGVRPAGARVERGSGACGVTDRTRGEEEKTTTARERPCSTAAAKTTRMNARRARLARVNRRSARAAPSLRTERRVKRRRETRTTTGDRKREKRKRRRPPQHATSVLNCGGENHPRRAAPSTDRRFEPSASALLRVGARPAAGNSDDVFVMWHDVRDTALVDFLIKCTTQTTRSGDRRALDWRPPFIFFRRSPPPLEARDARWL